VITNYAVRSDGPVIARNNTFLGGLSTAGGAANGAVVYLFGPSSLNAVFENNFFFQRSTAGMEPAILLANCAATRPIGVFENNFFALANTTLLSYTTGACGTQTFAEINAVETELAKGPSARVANNKRLAPPTCGAGETGCIATPACSPTVGPCGQSLFSSFQTDGISELLGGGLLLKSGTYCALTQGGKDIRNDVAVSFTDDAGADAGVVSLRGVTTDFLGNARTVPLSIGAHEIQDAGTCIP
jgi:hypothetical protein